MSFVVRAPTSDDADDLGRIHVRAWQAAYTGGLMPDDYLASLSVQDRTTMWREALGNDPRPRYARLVAEIPDGQIVGFALVGPAAANASPDDDIADEIGELYAINVDPGHWGTGAGSALIAAGLDALRSNDFTSAVLWVLPGNERARSFYETRGWRIDGGRRDQEVLGITVPEVRYAVRL